MKHTNITNQDELDEVLNKNVAVLLYFSKKTCSVGEAIEPKVVKMLEENYSKIVFYAIDMTTALEISKKYNVFVEPTILVFFDAKETIRKSRVFSISELSNTIKRIYKIAFE